MIPFSLYLFLTTNIGTFFLFVLAYNRIYTIYITLLGLLFGRKEIFVRKLYRSSKNSMIAGVCGGLGDYFNIDSTLIRLLCVILFFLGFGAIFLVYIVWIFVVPKEGDVKHL